MAAIRAAAGRCDRNGARGSVAFLGLRQGACLGLRIEDIDLEAATLRVERTLYWMPWEHGCAPTDAHASCSKTPGRCPNRTGGGPVLGPPKSRVDYRIRGHGSGWYQRVAGVPIIGLIRCELWRGGRCGRDSSFPHGSRLVP